MPSMFYCTNQRCLTFMQVYNEYTIVYFCSDSSSGTIDMPYSEVRSNSESEPGVRQNCRQCVVLKKEITTLKKVLATSMSLHFS